MITFERRDHTAVITLDSPTLDAATHGALWDAWKTIRFDSEIWTTILTGSGDTFCLGEDPAERSTGLPDRYHEPRDGKQWGYLYEHYRRRKLNVWKPVIVAVNGPCAGSGLVFVGQGDTILASDAATFSMPQVSLGRVPIESLVYLLDRVPQGIVARMALLGDTLDADRAREVALVSEVVPHADLADRALALADQINDQAGDAVRGMLAAMHMRRDFGYDDALLLGYEYHERFENTANQKEGPLAFTEKRKAQWSIRPPAMG